VSSFSSIGVAAGTLLGRTLWGEAAPQRATAHVSLRDEIWCHLVALQDRLREGSVSADGATRAAGVKGYCAARSCKPASSWARSTGRGAIVTTATPPDWNGGVEAKGISNGCETDKNSSMRGFLQPIRQTDVQRLWQRYVETMDKHREHLTAEWQRGELSNFGYLQSLNFMSGRSLEDLSQYPVMPWVLRNLRHVEPPSAVLARKDAEELRHYFRDLSKTLGDLGDPERRRLLEEKYILAREMENLPYHYGTHYSTPAFVMHFLVRLQPFTRLGRELQGGRYDVPDRIFSSLPDSWRSCLTETSDVRELVPELFSLPECLLNLSGLDLGVRQDGSRVSHVELPPWANNAYHFVHEHRLALESEPVSRSLHRWIDLVWGYKQTGTAAREALNVFYPLTYEDGVDWASVEPAMRHSKEQQVLHFGQTPRRLFTLPHPPRSAPGRLPSLLQASAAGMDGSTGETVAVWYSAAGAVPPEAMLRGALCGHSRPQRAQRAWSERCRAPVVAIAAQCQAGEAAKLFVVQADGALCCYRARHPQLCGPSGGAKSLAAFPLASVSDRGRASEPQVDLEARFLLPTTADGLRELLLTDLCVAQSAAAWAFLPEWRFFFRGGLRDGSVLFGGTSQQHAGVIPHAHDATVSAVAVSQTCARYVEDAHGLLLLMGAHDGTVSAWVAADSEWQGFARLVRWQVHLQAVRCLDISDQLGLALSSSEDGLVHVYSLRPPMRPQRTFAFRGRLPVSEARFGARAPASLVACSCVPSGPPRLNVWSLQGFLLATLELPAAARGGLLRVLCDGDAREGLLCAAGDGSIELRSLPYLQPVWRQACPWAARPTALDGAAARGFAWLGHEDGSFSAVFAQQRPHSDAAS